MKDEKIKDLTTLLSIELRYLALLLPEHIREDFIKEAYISGGCIYSLYNDKEPKDIDVFVQTKEMVSKIQNFFIETYMNEQMKKEYFSEKVNIFYHEGNKVIMTLNAISIGKYQIITRFYGKPKDVIDQFDFKHNMFYFQNNKIDTFSNWDFLETNRLVYNENRARDISGTILRVHKFVERGMKITNKEMSKILKKLREVGFTERENEIIDNTFSY